MKLNPKLTSLLLGTCVLAGPSASAMDPRDQCDSAETSASAVKVTEAAAEDAETAGAAAEDAETAGAAAEDAETAGAAAGDAETARAAHEAALEKAKAELKVAEAKLKAETARAIHEAALEKAKAELKVAEAELKVAKAELKVAEAVHNVAVIMLKRSEVFNAGIRAKNALDAAKCKHEAALSKVQQAKDVVSKEESVVVAKTGCRVHVANFANLNWSYCSLCHFLGDVYTGNSEAIIFMGDQDNTVFWTQDSQRVYFPHPLTLSNNVSFGVTAAGKIEENSDYDVYRLILYSPTHECISRYVNVVVYKGWDPTNDKASNDARAAAFLNSMTSKYTELSVLHIGRHNSLEVRSDSSDSRCPLSIFYKSLPPFDYLSFCNPMVCTLPMNPLTC